MKRAKFSYQPQSRQARAERAMLPQTGYAGYAEAADHAGYAERGASATRLSGRERRERPFLSVFCSFELFGVITFSGQFRRSIWTG